MGVLEPGALSARVRGAGDVVSLVVDVGSYNTKGGFAGDEVPKAVIPSVRPQPRSADAPVALAEPRAPGHSFLCTQVVGPRSTSKYYLGLEQLELRRKDMEIRPALSNGLVSDWDSLERLWSHLLLSELRVDPQQHPVLLSEPVHNTREARERAATTMFETHSVPALFFSKNAVLTAFAAGRSTALVFKSGHGRTFAVPVHDGFALPAKALSSPVTGRTIATQLLEKLAARGDVLKPRTAVVKQPTSGGEEYIDLDISSFAPSYRDFWMGELAHDIKASGCVRFGPGSGPDAEGPAPTSFDLPDGKKLQEEEEPVPGPESMAALIANSIKNCELNVDVKKELYATVVVTGGNTLFPGFVERLSADTTRLLNIQQPKLGSKLGILAPRTATERHFSTWIGGSSTPPPIT